MDAATKEIWMWEYTIEYQDENPDEDGPLYRYVLRHGVVGGHDIKEAVAVLYDFYGEDMTNIKELAAFEEGNCFEFEAANENDEFNYKVSKKGDL